MAIWTADILDIKSFFFIYNIVLMSDVNGCGRVLCDYKRTFYVKGSVVCSLAWWKAVSFFLIRAVKNPERVSRLNFSFHEEIKVEY